MMRRSPKGCCETLSKARLYAFTSVCNGIFVPGNVLAVRYVAMSPSLLCQANPKCGLPDFFRGTAVCRSQAFARAFRAGSVFVGTARCPRLRFIRRVPNAACQTPFKARLYAARRRLRGHSAPAAFSSVRRIATPRLRFVRRNPKCSLPGFFQGTAVCRLQAFAMGFSRSTAFSSVQQLLPRPRFLPGAVPNVACQISSKVRPYTVRRRLHERSAPSNVFVSTTHRYSPAFALPGTVPNAAC